VTTDLNKISESKSKRIILMRRVFISSFAIVMFVLSLVVLNAFAQTSPKQDSILIKLANEDRTKLGLSSLEYNATLQKAAQAKAQDMLSKQYFEHVSPTGQTPWSFIEKAGYNYTYAGENLAIDFNDLSLTHKAWMQSPSHRQNILDPNFHEIGIASVSGQFNGHPTVITVEMFGTSAFDSTINQVKKLW
jgi:uncharacterized protein YkwD